MLNKKTTKDYVAELAKEYNLPKKTVQKLLVFGTKNMCRMIRAGEDIQLQHFGSIYFDKKAYAKYIKAIKENEQQITNQSSDDISGHKTNQ